MSSPHADRALLVVGAGVAAALHVGKLPTAIPVLRDALGVTLVEAGFLLSLVQFAGMLLGLAVGLAADGLGLKRTMVSGLALLAVASALGALAQSAEMLMALRAVEGVGFLLASMPAPSLIRRHVGSAKVNAALGLWGAYMPFGTAVALLAGPPVMDVIGWRGWWLLLALVAAVMAAVLWFGVPQDPRMAGANPAGAWQSRLRETLRSRGPWWVALCFCVYSAQWLSVIGFLPTVMAQAGFTATSAGAATALAALVNMAGNIAAGRFLQRGARPALLLSIGFVAMGCGALAAFSSAPGGVRYAGVLVFSMVGGLVPGTLFSLGVRLAPGDENVSTTVGWMQQWSAIGQFAGPPLVAWVAQQAGGWQWSGAVTGTFALAGLLFAGFISLVLRGHAARI
ncbi:MAG TPA: MFS transporter [Ramlibacter sp.]|nr:MFS transporter [Ramlibacter sp.]